MGAVKHFLGNYSENFAAALVLWPALSFLLTLPILAYLYHRDGRLRFGTFVGAYLTVLYVCGLGCFTLYPLPSGDAGLGITYGVAPNFNPMNFANDIAKDGLKAARQVMSTRRRGTCPAGPGTPRRSGRSGQVAGSRLIHALLHWKYNEQSQV